MKNFFTVLTAFLLIPFFSQAQYYEGGSEKIYEVNLAVDLPIALAGTALTGYGFKRIVEKPKASLERINSLDYNNVSGFNRFFMESPNYSSSAAKASHVLFYGAFPVGFGVAAFEKRMKKDFWTIAMMYWEALAINGAIYANTAAAVERYRPLAYPGSGAPDVERTKDGVKDGFPGGHPTITATATFFTAKVLQDYYPNRKGLHIAAYSTASVLTLANVYLRHRAGKHFATDLLTGLSYSIPISILVPHLHKIAKDDSRLSVDSGPMGMQISYTIE